MNEHKRPAEAVKEMMKVRETGPEDMIEYNLRLLNRNREKIQKDNRIMMLQQAVTKKMIEVLEPLANSGIRNSKLFKMKDLDIPELRGVIKKGAGAGENSALKRSHLKNSKDELFDEFEEEIEPGSSSKVNNRTLRKNKSIKVKNDLENSVSQVHNTPPNRSALASRDSIPKMDPKDASKVEKISIQSILKRGVSVHTFTMNGAVGKLRNVLSVKMPEEPKEDPSDEIIRNEQDFWLYVYSLKAEYHVYNQIVMRPPSRELGELARYSLNGKEYLILYGGIGYETFSDVWTIPVPKKHHADKAWTQHEIRYESHPATESISLFLSTFSITHYRGKPKAFIFGGTLKIGKSSYMDFPNNTLYKLDLETFQAKVLTPLSPSTPSARRHHASCFLGQVLYVIGGIDYTKEEHLDEVWKYSHRKHLSN